MEPRLVLYPRLGSPLCIALYGGFAACVRGGAEIATLALFAEMRALPIDQQPIPVGLVEAIDQALEVEDAVQAGQSIISLAWPKTPLFVLEGEEVFVTAAQRHAKQTLVQLQVVIDLSNDDSKALYADLLCALSGGNTAYLDLGELLAQSTWQTGGQIVINELPTFRLVPENEAGCQGPIRMLVCPSTGGCGCRH